MNELELKEFLDYKAEQYESADFIESDPIQIPHQFNSKADIEISAFFVAMLAWGNRKSIIKSGEKLVEIMGNAPHDYIMNYDKNTHLKFAHRTFNGTDLDFFFRSLHQIYKESDLEACFKGDEHSSLMSNISGFREIFFSTEHEYRSEKHISNPLKNSACKRLVMYLRWMVRDSKKGVDFGIWNNIKPAQLYIPLDIHTGNISRKLGILSRSQSDWKASEELINYCRKLDPEDPAKYDFALFGLGAFENF